MTGELAASEGDTNGSPLRAAWRAGLGAETRALLDADERHFIRQSLSTPCLDAIERAQGPWLVDVEGRHILDFHGNSVHQLGHGHPRVVAAIKDQIDRLPFSPRRYTNRPAIDLARRLGEVAPGSLSKVLFAPSGAAAVGMALKLARYATGRHKTLSMWDSFHGANLDTIAVGGEALFRRGLGPMMPGAEHLPPLHLAARFFGPDRPFERYADYVDYLLEVQGDVAALLAEPVRWTSVEPAPPGFWARVRDSCTRHGALLIFDEIPSGLARTGTLWACEGAGAAPDILVIGKGLGGGIMPMAAILADPRLDAPPMRPSATTRTRRAPWAARRPWPCSTSSATRTSWPAPARSAPAASRRWTGCATATRPSATFAPWGRSSASSSAAATGPRPRPGRTGCSTPAWRAASASRSGPAPSRRSARP